MMGRMNLGMPEMIFIFLMALMVFGPRKLPELARQLGKVMAEFKRASNEFKYQLESEISAVDLQDSQTKRQELTHTILPPERAVSDTVPQNPQRFTHSTDMTMTMACKLD